MPEKGWAILTVGDGTARKVKEATKAKGLTVAEYIRAYESLRKGRLVHLQPLRRSPKIFGNTRSKYTQKHPVDWSKTYTFGTTYITATHDFD
ncbi:MAG: hypothetical protein ACUVQM_06720 [Candidatus Hadarchaeaceae archaeon]